MVTARREIVSDEETPAWRGRDGEAVGAAAVAPETWRNPTFGMEYWRLGLAAALPSFLAALALLACAGFLPLLPRPPVGVMLGVLLTLLALGAVAAHATDYPAWTHPGVALIPTLALFLPFAVVRGQIVTRVNGDPDLPVVVPLAITWLLLLAATVTIVAVALAVGRHAPSFSGLALLPLPLVQAWLLILAPPFHERVVTGALGSALALVAFATFAAWVAPTRLRPYVPLAAIAAQFGIFWLQRFPWPTFNGALRPVIALDVALLVGLVGVVGIAPFLSSWARHSAWPTIRQFFD